MQVKRFKKEVETTCPIHSALSLISAKWAVEIMREAASGPVRTRQFLRLIPGVSMKSLQERLRELQTSGMLERTEISGKIPHVEHTITDRGRRLLIVLNELKKIGGEMSGIACKCTVEGVCKSELDCPVLKLAVHGGS